MEGYHEFHEDADFAVVVECSVKADDIGRVTFVEDFQFSDDLIANSRFNFQMNDLP